MANDIIDINVTQTVETVEITVTPNLTTVNINQVTGGGGGVTNLSTTQTDTNFTINSDTGDDAIVPLANGLLAGATINDYTTPEKTKLAGIAIGAEVNVNADWNAVSGDAQILNKPIIPSITNLVPYTGATSDVNLGEYGIQLGNLEFDNTPTNIPTATGSIYYNDTDGTLDIILKGGNVKLQIGQESVIRVVNKTATNIDLLETNYQAVRVTGAQGQRMKIDLAQATTDVLSAETIGLVTETIANNQEGFITTSGLVRNINTTGSLQSETWFDGDVLYLSPTVAGSITKIKPIAPNHLIIIGYVIHAHATQGTIFVKVDNGYELNELHNVKINGVANNNVLAYTSSTSIWENKTVQTVLGYTPANDSNVVHLTGSETIAGTKTFSSNIVIPATGSALILSVSSGGTISGLTTTIYPNLTELTYLKGVTSAIQTQLNGKQPLNTILTNTTASFTTAYETKLSGIATGAEVNVNADWNAVSGDAQILNKPTIPSLVTETNQPYLGTPAWSGGLAPSGTTTHTYSLSQIGNLVTLTINLAYGVAGASTLTSVAVELPSTAPTPILPDSVTAVGEVIGYGNGIITVAKTIPTTNAPFCALRIKTLGTPNVYEVLVIRAQASYRYAYITIQYFTA